MNRLQHACVGFLLAAALAGTGCTTTSPAPRWHSLVAAAPAAAASAPATRARSLVVGLVTVPDEVDRPTLVLRDAAGTPTVLEGERWSEPLKAQLPRALALTLAGRLPGTVVAAQGGGAIGLPSWRVSVNVQRFELRRDPDRAVLRVVWTLRPGGVADSGATPMPQVFETIIVPAGGATPPALVAAMGTALDQLSGTISRSVCAAGPC